MWHEGKRDPDDAFWVGPNFALFVLIDLPPNDINSILQQNRDKAGAYQLWLATDNWATAPRSLPDGTPGAGTIPPVSDEWTSPFKDKTIEDVVAFMKTSPDGACVDWHHFVVLGEDYVSRGYATLYKIGDRELKGDIVTSLPVSVAKASLFLGGTEEDVWEEELADQKDNEPIG